MITYTHAAREAKAAALRLSIREYVWMRSAISASTHYVSMGIAPGGAPRLVQGQTITLRVRAA